MNVWWHKGNCPVRFPGLDQPALSCLRLLKFHAPAQRIEVFRLDVPQSVPLEELDFSHERIEALNVKAYKARPAIQRLPE